MPDALDRPCHQRFIYIIRIILETNKVEPAILSEDENGDQR